MCATCCQNRAMCFEMPVSHHNDTVTKLAMKPLVVELLKDLLKVSWKIHDPIKQNRRNYNIKNGRSPSQTKAKPDLKMKDDR